MTRFASVVFPPPALSLSVLELNLLRQKKIRHPSSSQCLGEIEFGSDVKAVRLSRDRFVIMGEERVFPSPNSLLGAGSS